MGKGLLLWLLGVGHRLIGALATHLNKVARQLNERPHETLQFETRLAEHLSTLASEVEAAIASQLSGGEKGV